MLGICKSGFYFKKKVMRVSVCGRGTGGGGGVCVWPGGGGVKGVRGVGKLRPNTILPMTGESSF